MWGGFRVGAARLPRRLGLAVAIGIATGASAAPPALELSNGAATLRIDAIADDILRIRVAPGGRFGEDASWAVLPDMRGAHVSVAPLVSEPPGAGFRTAALVIRVDRASLRVSITNPAGEPISTDLPQPFVRAGNAFELRKSIAPGEHIFALGDKTGPLDRRGRSFVDWNTDTGVTETVDPIYKSIPFFVSAGGAGGSYGLLLDDTFRSWFDFGHREAGTLAIGAAGGAIDYYVIAGPATAAVVRRYADLTGKPPMLPKWAFGYQQSRYSYLSADETRAIAARFREDGFPLDVLWLDIDYQDRNRPFTTDPKTFPDLSGLVGDLGKAGVKLVTITDLHVAHAPGQGYAPYDSGHAGDHFVHAADGREFVGKVWPGAAVFPDFTEESARRWWGDLYRPFAAAGVAGFWNDMNEPSVFDGPGGTMPLDAIHRISGSGFSPRTATHAEIHNVFGAQNSRATYEGLLRIRPDERPFVMTRSSFAGGQRWATTWTGDNASRWSQLKLAVAQTLNLGLSGFAYTADDVGGFGGGPSPELLTRWFEVQTFLPLFRDHATKGSPPQEPWVDGPAQEAIRRHYVEERYRLMPYIYALADETHRTGAPLARPLFYDYPDALAARCDQSMSFTLGTRLLIAGSPQPESPAPYQVCLPKGGWYDYWSDRAPAFTRAGDPTFGVYDVVTETPALERLPVYVRAGTILPKQPLVQSLSETPRGPLELHIWPGEDCRGTIYEDDGHSFVFERGDYLRQEVRCVVTPTGLAITFGPREGRYRPWWHDVAVAVHVWAGDGARSAAGKLSHTRDAMTGLIWVQVPDPARPMTIRLDGHVAVAPAMSAG